MLTTLSIYIGFCLVSYSDNWHFKDSVQTRFGYPQYVVYEYFSVLKF